jgi:hypothetical protein
MIPLPARLWVVALLLCLGSVGACGEDDRPASFTYISSALLRPNCATSGCHSKLTATAGLRLDTREAGYTLLVGGTSVGPHQPVPPQNLVVPGDPARSVLIQRLRASEVYRMPPDGVLPDADIELIERWILEGAQNN